MFQPTLSTFPNIFKLSISHLHTIHLHSYLEYVLHDKDFNFLLFK